MSKFKVGDPVWVTCRMSDLPGLHRGEMAAVIVRFIGYCPTCRANNEYEIEVLGFTPPPPFIACHATEPWLRPRRDDYQQHEALGSMDEVFAPSFSKRSIELAAEAIKEAEADARAMRVLRKP